MNKIYVKESDIPLTRTRKDLIKKFLRAEAYNSYSDKECIVLQCENLKYRSITELNDICRSRFPITSLKAVIKIINELINSDSSIILVYCPTVEKVVIKYDSSKSGKWISNFSKKNYYETKGVDGYSLKDFEDIKNSL